MRGRHFKTGLILLLCLAADNTAIAQSRTPVTWVIFVDDLHLDFRNTGRIRDAIRTMVKELVQEGDNFAIASSGPSAIAVDLTTDRELLAGAIRKVTGNGLRFQDIQATRSAAEVRYRAGISLATAQSILDSLSRLQSWPAAVLFISSGHSVDMVEEMAALTETAARSTTRIFAIDPRVAMDAVDLDSLNPAWPSFKAATQKWLRAVSESSGGFAIVEGAFVTELRRVAAALGR